MSADHGAHAADLRGGGRPVDERAGELAERLAAVRRRIAAACAAAGRDPREVTIVAITKSWPPDDVRRLAALGLSEMGENRDQEARAKVADCADLGLVWHFVGQLQRNKARSVAQYVDVVQSVDRLALVGDLDRAAAGAGRRIGICLQVDLDDPETAGRETAGRGGARPELLAPLADAVADAEALDLLGVMAVAPKALQPARAFGRLAATHERLLVDHPTATIRSAGMSGDLDDAVSAGATHLRLGSALLGRRDPLK